MIVTIEHDFEIASGDYVQVKLHFRITTDTEYRQIDYVELAKVEVDEMDDKVGAVITPEWLYSNRKDEMMTLELAAHEMAYEEMDDQLEVAREFDRDFKQDR